MKFTLSLINSTPHSIFYKKLIFLYTKDTRILLFLVEHYTILLGKFYYQGL